MKNYLILSALILLFSCTTENRVQKIYAQNKVAVFTHVQCARDSYKEGLLFLVFHDTDKVNYNLPVAKLLQLDTTKDDCYSYHYLCNQYAAIKLYRSEFDAFLNTLTDSTDLDFTADGLAYDRSKTFMFICHREILYFYGATPIDIEKPYLLAHWVNFMGP